MTRPNYRKLLLAACLCGALASCNSGDDEVAPEAARMQIQAILDSAELYRSQGQFRASLVETRNALELMPDNVDVLAFIARLYLEIGEFEPALEQLAQALQNQPGSNALKLLQAEALLAANRIDEGLQLLQSLQVETEQLAQKNWLLGNLQAAAGNLQGAEIIFRNSLASDSSHVLTLISMSKLSYLKGDVEAANDYVAQAVGATSSDSVDLWIWRGQLALLQENYPAAEAAFFEALDIMSLYDLMTAKRYSTLQSILVPLQMQQKDAEALRYSQILAATPQGEFGNAFQNAMSLFQQGTGSQAEAALNELIAVSPNHPGVNILMGIAKYNSGDVREAQRLLSTYVDTGNASSEVISTLAATHLRLNQPEIALSLLEEALANNPGDIGVMTRIAVVQRGLGNVGQSIETLMQAADLAPQAPQVRLALAGSYVRLADFASAIAELEQALVIDPEFEEAKSALLDVYTRQNDPDAAFAAVQSWLRENQSSVYNNMAAALLAMSSQNYASARDYLAYVLELAPRNLQAQLYLARIDIEEEKYADAAAIFDAVLQLQSDNADALSGLLALGNLTGTAQSSIERIQQLVTRNPGQFTPPLILSQYFLIGNDFKRALEYAELAYGAVQNEYTRSLLADLNVRLAMQAAQQQDLPRARERMARVMEIQPDSIQGMVLLAGIEADSGNDTEAQSYVARIRELQPGSAFSYEIEGDLALDRNDASAALAAWQAGWERQHAPTVGQKMYQLMMAQGHGTEARAFLEAWLAAEPASVPAQVLLAIDLQGSNETEQAIARFEQVRSVEPDNIFMLNNLAWLYMDAEPALALELASRGAELYPRNADMLDTYGWILYQQNDREQALVVLEKALALAPTNASVLEHLETVRQ